MDLLSLGGSVFSVAERAVSGPSSRPSSRMAAATRSPVPGAISQRYYQAAQDSRLTHGMASMPISADAITQRTLTKLRARSRQEAAINDYVKKFLSLLDTNVVGPKGIILRPQFMNADGTPDLGAAQAVEDRWKLFCKKGNCDLTGTLSWLDIQSLVLRTTAVDGEIFLREVIGPQAGPQGYALELLDPELLLVDDTRELGNGNLVRMGIEYNQADQPVAFWMLQNDRTVDTLSTGYHGREAKRIPASRVIHCFLPERVGQHRGGPWTGTSLMRLALYEGMEDAVLVAARVGASKLGWFKRNPAGQGWTGDDQGKDGEIFMDAEVGTFGELPFDVSLEQWDPAFPNGEFGPFSASVLRGISSGMNVPYESLSNDRSGVNYSSIRDGKLEARDVYKRMQEWMVEWLNSRVYESWLLVQLLSGSIKLGNGSPLPLRKLDKFMRVGWQTPRWEWIDPLKEAQAQELQIARGTLTESEAIRQRGRDPEDVWQERKREEERKAKLGLPTVGGSLVGSAPGQLAPVEPDAAGKDTEE